MGYGHPVPDRVTTKRHLKTALAWLDNARMFMSRSGDMGRLTKAVFGNNPNKTPIFLRGWAEQVLNVEIPYVQSMVDAYETVLSFSGSEVVSQQLGQLAEAMVVASGNSNRLHLTLEVLGLGRMSDEQIISFLRSEYSVEVKGSPEAYSLKFPDIMSHPRFSFEDEEESVQPASTQGMIVMPWDQLSLKMIEEMLASIQHVEGRIQLGNFLHTEIALGRIKVRPEDEDKVNKRLGIA